MELPSDQGEEILVDFFPFIRVYKSGHVHRFHAAEPVPAGLDPITNVVSKDLTINPTTELAVRLYIPAASLEQSTKLPILVYFHGGGFVIESAFSKLYHYYINDLVSKANVVAVSVNYRLAPEHKLPAAYDDCMEALQWVCSHAAGTADPAEQWLSNHADFGRLFLAGDSAGANIVHNVVMRTLDESLRNGVKIKGAALFHPYFWGSKAVGSEVYDAARQAKMESMWTFLWREDSVPADGIDDPRINPLAGGAEKLKCLPVEFVLVAVAQKDFLKERGKVYCEALKESGWGGTVKFIESEDEDHVFYLMKPECEKAKELMDAMVELLKSE